MFFPHSVLSFYIRFLRFVRIQLGMAPVWYLQKQKKANGGIQFASDKLSITSSGMLLFLNDVFGI